MCGIILAVNEEKDGPVNEKVKEMLEDQIERGNKGFGIISINDDHTFSIKRATELVKPMVDLTLNPSNIILLHHRQPTSSPNRISQTHPLEIKNGSLKYGYYVMHNGIIHNEKELKAIHEALGFNYLTVCSEWSYNRWEPKFNDSEAFAIELARYIDGQIDEMDVRGSIAFIALQTEKVKGVELARRIYYGRTNNPLVMSRSRNRIRVSSEGGGEEVEKDKLFHFGLDNFKLIESKLKFKEIKIVPLHNPADDKKEDKDDEPVTGDMLIKDRTDALDQVRNRLHKNIHTSFDDEDKDVTWKGQDFPPEDEFDETCPYDKLHEEYEELIEETATDLRIKIETEVEEAMEEIIDNDNLFNEATIEHIKPHLEEIIALFKKAKEEAKELKLEYYHKVKELDVDLEMEDQLIKDMEAGGKKKEEEVKVEGFKPVGERLHSKG